MGYESLFDSYPVVAWMVDEYIDLLGGLPPEWSSKYPNLVTDDGFDDECLNDECWSWEEQFKIIIQEPRRDLGMEQVGEEEKAAFFDMIKAMIVYKPEERMTAAEVRQSEWMTKWAMPELLIANTFNWPAKIDMLTL